jgi:hypothetical protein
MSMIRWLYACVLLGLGLAASFLTPDAALADSGRAPAPDSESWPPDWNAEYTSTEYAFRKPAPPRTLFGRPLDSLMLCVGFVGSPSFTSESTLGLEASLPWFSPEEDGFGGMPAGFGPVVQWQRLHTHDRLMAGLEYAGMLGAEVGYSLRETNRGRVHGVHVAPFVSVGPVPVLGRYPIVWK